MQTTPDNISILIVDDEIDIREILQFNLENEGYVVDQAESGEEALSKLSSQHDLILLDVMMGGMSGFKMADQLRKLGNNIPIIFLTAKDTENDMLTGFSIGADDYIAKPFSVKEVLARVKSVLKRAESKKTGDGVDILKVDALMVDLVKKVVFVDDILVELTKTEYNLLTLLMKNEGVTFSRSDILARAWEGDGLVSERTVDVHIARIRKKIGRYGDAIVNRTGYGYNFSLQ